MHLAEKLVSLKKEKKFSRLQRAEMLAVLLCLSICVIAIAAITHKANYRRYVDDISSMEKLLADESKVQAVEILSTCDYITDSFPGTKGLRFVGFQTTEDLQQIRLAAFAEESKGFRLLQIIPQSFMDEIARQISTANMTVNIDGITRTFQIVVSVDSALDSIEYRVFSPGNEHTGEWKVIKDIQSPTILILEDDTNGDITEYRFFDSGGNEIK